MVDKLEREKIAPAEDYSLTPKIEVTEFINKESYIQACFSLVGAAELVSFNTFNKEIAGLKRTFVSLWEEAPESDEGKEEMLKEVPIYRVFDALYQYGQLGNAAFKDKINEADMFDLLPLLHMSSFIYEELYSAESNSYLILTMLHKYLARLKLDTEQYLDDLGGPGSGWLPFSHPEHFNLYEIALLANVKSINSIRNSTYAKEDRLETFKEDGRALVTREVARDWLSRRKHFIKTFSPEEASATSSISEPSLTYVTRIGKNKGQIQIPHKHANGMYVVSKTRFKEDYVYVKTINEILDHLQKGYKLRMSGKNVTTSPSLVALSSIDIN
ncbi:hypothetical protein JCM19236_2704 [Vibrio sp. JCM 19236]|nr:hypothetical protein JCM19236_2704 [Vibrio sp. JCM 19236]